MTGGGNLKLPKPILIGFFGGAERFVMVLPKSVALDNIHHLLDVLFISYPNFFSTYKRTITKTDKYTII